MKITKSGDNELTIDGTITSIEDSNAVREAVQRLFDSGSRTITLRITSSFAIPSAAIGYLTKLVKRDNVRLTLKVGDVRLYELLDELNLIATFGVTR